MSANFLCSTAFATSDALCHSQTQNDYQILFKPGWSDGWFYSTALAMKNGALLRALTCEWDYFPGPGQSAAYHCYEPGMKKLNVGLKATILPQQGTNSHYTDPSITYSAQLYRGTLAEILAHNLICRDVEK